MLAPKPREVCYEVEHEKRARHYVRVEVSLTRLAGIFSCLACSIPSLIAYILITRCRGIGLGVSLEALHPSFTLWCGSTRSALPYTGVPYFGIIA